MRNMNYKSKKIKSQGGFSIFVAVIVTSALLLAALTVANIGSKQSSFSTSNRQSESALYAADAGIECALYWDAKVAVSAFSTSTPGTISCAGSSMSGGQSIPGTTTPSLVGGGGGGSVTSDSVWVEDSLPGGTSQEDPFNWSGSGPAPFSGSLSNRSQNKTGNHQQYFTGGSPFTINTGDSLVAYVYLNSASPPTEIMLQWDEGGGTWNHRAYWGANSISWGTDGTNSRRYMGALPATGQWVRLSIPANLVGLEEVTINSMAFTLYDGQANWDHAGKSFTTGGGGGNPTSVFGFSLNSAANPTNSCFIVTVTKNSDASTHIFSRGYDTCNTSDPKRVERGIELKY